MNGELSLSCNPPNRRPDKVTDAMRKAAAAEVAGELIKLDPSMGHVDAMADDIRGRQ